MLAGPRWGTPDRLAADARARFYLGRTRSHSASLTSYVDRDRSFGLVLDALARLDDPTAIETGTIRADEDWGGAGCSTLLLAMAFAARGRGHLHSVDCDPRNVRFARDRTAGYRAHVTVHEARGVDHLRASAGPIDLFYSDSLDADRPGHAENCLAEVKAAAPRLRSNESMVLIDDTVCDRGRWRGKGALAVPYLLDVGWRLVYAGYQALLDRHRA
jgi:predicted O-methyltransferase YrrM